jgi:hypothetical protein
MDRDHESQVFKVGQQPRAPGAESIRARNWAVAGKAANIEVRDGKLVVEIVKSHGAGADTL